MPTKHISVSFDSWFYEMYLEARPSDYTMSSYLRRLITLGFLAVVENETTLPGKLVKLTEQLDKAQEEIKALKLENGKLLAQTNKRKRQLSEKEIAGEKMGDMILAEGLLGEKFLRQDMETLKGVRFD